MLETYITLLLCVWPSAFHSEYKLALPPEMRDPLVVRGGHRRLRGEPSAGALTNHPVGAIRQLLACY